jgi:uncharacterized protein DUF29
MALIVKETPPAESPNSLYDRDYYGWIQRNVHAIRGGRVEEVDWANLVEELEAMARSEESGLESHLANLLVHLLKWRYQPNKRTGSWEASIENSRDQIVRLLQRSPSLKSKIDEAFRTAYRLARRAAGGEMGLSKREWEQVLPVACEWSLGTVCDDSFWPDPSDTPVAS